MYLNQLNQVSLRRGAYILPHWTVLSENQTSGIISRIKACLGIIMTQVYQENSIQKD